MNRYIIAVVIAALAALAYWVSQQNKLAPTEPEVARQIEQTEAVPLIQGNSEVATVSEPEQAVADEDGRRTIVIGKGQNLFTAFAELGLTDIEGSMSKWSIKKGFPVTDASGNYLTEQPYQQYDTETLRAFAENNDMWAQQILAERLEKTNPAEAVDWYRKAASNGSLHAMNRLSMLYQRIGHGRADAPNVSDEYKEQIYALRDSDNSPEEMSFAWSVASGLAGGDPTAASAAGQRMARRFDEPARERACQLAQGLYDDMTNSRTQAGLGDFDRTPPPFILGLSQDPVCPEFADRQTVDTSSCEQVDIVSNGMTSSIMVCSN